MTRTSSVIYNISCQSIIAPSLSIMSHIRSHPLRRVSTGSLSNLARSQDGHHPAQSSASGLDFLTSAMMDLSDEAATLASHLNHMNSLHESLGTFNEAFAGYLYALRMNAFCVEWTEVSCDRRRQVTSID
jgi:DASH complex subunit DAM1